MRDAKAAERSEDGAINNVEIPELISRNQRVQERMKQITDELMNRRNIRTRQFRWYVSFLPVAELSLTAAHAHYNRRD